MKVVIVLGLVACCFTSAVLTSNTSKGDIDKEWKAFKAEYKKLYKSYKEESYRKSVFLENKSKIDRHNELYVNAHVTYSMRMNQFGDSTFPEIERRRPILAHTSTNRTRSKNRVEIPDSVDWRKEGYVTHVKDQKHCDSGWAFSATGAVEGAVFKKTGELILLSEQNLIDCATTRGCSGNITATLALKYIVDKGGIESEKCYPYEGMDGEKCAYDHDFAAASVSTFRCLPADDDLLAEAVAEVGPVAVTINTLCKNFRFYHGGMFAGAGCPTADPDHSMLVVGYGVDQTGSKYWTLKNSWGSHWGDGGYMMLSRDVPNACGVSDNPVYPIA